LTTKKESIEGLINIEKSKKIGNNTYEIIYKNGDKSIRLHYTDILTFKNNGEIILNSGGWNTNTTKDRLNHYLPSNMFIYQKNFIWYLRINDKDYLFKDNMRIKNDKVLNYKNPDKEVKKINKLKKDVDKYIKGYMQKLTNRKLDKPSESDCFYCTILKEVKDKEHIKMHIKESYYVPSLIINAIKFKPISPIARETLSFYFKYHNNNIEYLKEIANRQIESSLKRYLYKELNLGC